MMLDILMVAAPLITVLGFVFWAYRKLIRATDSVRERINAIEKASGERPEMIVNRTCYGVTLSSGKMITLPEGTLVTLDSINTDTHLAVVRVFYDEVKITVHLSHLSSA